ncbi:acyltransferase family protein [Butyrivibrio fibrisolvens]|uniref:acyltransferase family protein n=1 Tax=Butyrivibrio fibrisolvens TaxID=831 RepID=UPI0003FD64F1|nr:acyltransferase [Butyrivibrio fibrisolvens]
MKEKRIEWIDIYKAIAIILVVIGHATGKFNLVIYQFHMAAFFLISGYTSNLSNKSLVNTIVSKFFSLILPYVSVSFISIVFVKILDRLHIYSYIFPVDYMLPFDQMIKQLLGYGNIYVQFLGALWFLPVLYGAYIINRIALKIANNKYGIIHIIICLCLFLLGYNLVKSPDVENIGFFNLDLICIAQFYFCVGIYCKKIVERIDNTIDGQKYIRYIIGAVICCSLMYYFGYVNWHGVDYPSRSFGSAFSDAIKAINGSVFIFLVARFFDSILPKKIKKGIIYIGNNTLGIMMFHFLWFKLCYCFLYKVKIMTREDVLGVVPPPEIGNSFWWLFTIVGIVGSIVLFSALSHIPGVAFFIGKDRMTYKKMLTKIDAFISSKEKDKNLIIFEKIYRIKNINLFYVAHILILIILVCVPLFRQGIMCNDELQTRYWMFTGIKNAYNHYFTEHILKGRALSTPIVSLTICLGFLGQTNYLFKILQIISILFDMALFGILVSEVFQSKKFGLFCSTTALVFLPITFEHTEPNAFVTLYCIPFAFLLISLIVFVKYLKSPQRKSLIWGAMILFFIVQTSYEAFITFLPFYFILGWYLLGTDQLKKRYKTFLAVLITGLIFLILYVIAGKVFVSNYQGNQIANIEINESFKIIKQLFVSTFPGYYLVAPKYQVIWSNYKFFSPSFLVRSFLVALLYGCLVYKALMIHKECDDNLQFSGNKKRSIYFIILLIAQIICTTLPVSIASMYQGNVGQQGFIALPVTYFGYYVTVLLCCYIVFCLIRILDIKLLSQCVLLAVTIILLCVQYRNDIFSTEQYENFARIERIEKMIQSKCICNADGEAFYSSDIFETRNALAIHDNHWTVYAIANGVNVTFVKSDQLENTIYSDDNCHVFSIKIGNKICVLSDGYIGKKIPIQISDNESKLAECTEYVKDGDWYCYYFELIDGSDEVMPINEEAFYG